MTLEKIQNNTENKNDFQTKPIKTPRKKSYLTKKKIKAIRKRKAIAILLPLAIASVVITITWQSTIKTIASTPANQQINIITTDNIQNKLDSGQKLSIEEHIWYILDKEYNLTFKERIRAMAIIYCESNFYPYAINANSNGTFDLGVWQINSRHHNITRACSFDVYCSTRYAMDEIYLKQGNWSAWVCAR